MENLEFIIKSHSLMPGVSNLAFLMFSKGFFYLVKAHMFMKSRSCNGLAAKGLSQAKWSIRPEFIPVFAAWSY